MADLRKTFTALVAAAALSAASAVANAAEDRYGDSVSTAPSAEAMAFDLILIRPLGLVATVAGVGLFVVQLPISLFTWNLHDPAERLVVEPARFTFARDLGSMD
jgi:hypothetical protein